MSNDQDKKKKEATLNALEKLFLNDDEPSKKDKALQQLQSSLDASKDAHLQERFVWFVVVNVMFDAFTFKEMQTWTGPLMIGLIQIIVIISLGRVWQMDPIWTLTEKIVDKWNGKFKN